VLREIFEPRRDEVRGKWRRLHNEELRDLYCSPNIIGVIKSRRTRWVGHVARMGLTKILTGFWWGELRERDHLQDLGIEERNCFTRSVRGGGGRNDWIDLDQVRDRWRTLVTAAMNHRVP